VIHGNLKYKVYFQPLLDQDDNTYLAEIDVTDRITSAGVGSIRQSIDASDYNIGVFVFSDLEIDGYNFNGYFNENDTRSIFPSIRDRCKVRVVFQKNVLTRDQEGTVLEDTETENITYRGIINDEATRLDIVTGKIRFKVLSRDSVLRTTQVSGGVVNSGDLASEAMYQILNVPRITSVLGVSPLNIDPDYDFTIDVGSVFNNQSVKESLDKLLLASNSCMLIEDDGTVLIRSRDEDGASDPVALYGQYDEMKRENIIDITAYNTGKHRNYTSIVVNGIEAKNEAFVASFGLRQKSFTFDFITDNATELTIADRLMNEFKVPKIEMNVKVATDLTNGLRLLDRVTVNYPLRVEPAPGSFLPVVDITKIDDSDQPLPLQFGSIEILPRVGFKIIEIEHSPEKFTSILKLRQYGTELDDGYIDGVNNCLVGFAVIESAEICSGGGDCDAFLVANIGGASVGCTLIA